MSPTERIRAESILVAEDDTLIHDLLITRLEVSGYRTFGARDGFEAFRRLAELRPDILVLDINMPGIDGFEVLRRKAIRFDDGLVGREAIDGRVVLGVVAHQGVRVGAARQAAQDLRQVRWADLAGSTGAVAELGQLDTAFQHLHKLQLV